MLQEETQTIKNLLYLLACKSKINNSFYISSKRKQKAIDDLSLFFNKDVITYNKTLNKTSLTSFGLFLLKEAEDLKNIKKSLNKKCLKRSESLQSA